jgi:hypothetical protein
MKKEQTHIVVLTQGFVYMGNIEVADGWITIRDAKNIRVWGTTKGLGELAITGPTKSTVLDLAGYVRAPLTSLVHTILCL